jgi:signal transduction histidine kinase
VNEPNALPTVELLAQITALRQEVEKLKREKEDMALILELRTEHADNPSEVKRFNEHLELLVQERTHELAQANRKLELMNISKSDFIATLAHELRTPLTLIKGYASLLQTTVKHLPDASQLVTGILNGEERLLEVVNSILDVLKIDSQTLEVRKELTGLNMIIKSTVKEFQKVVADRHLKLNLIGLDQLPKIQADPDLMSKLFAHLISNAIKYTPDGGSITVKGNLIHSNTSEKTQNQWIQILINDTGIGIDPTHQQMIFEKFYQTGPAQLHSSSKTKFKGGGPGLGLAIAKGIMEAHGGRIWVESPGYDEQSCPGSTFHLLLPLNVH